MLCIALTSACYKEAPSSIEAIQSLDAIDFKSIDSETLVIFDVDDVLITPRDQILQHAFKKELAPVIQAIERRYGKKEEQRFWSIIWLARKNELVEPQVVNIIKELQSRSIKVIALTNAFTGSFGDLPSLEDWRINELAKYDIHFKKSWPMLSDKTFAQLKSEDPMRFPAFKNGILFTCYLSKGDVLKAFLPYAGLIPKKIIFIDDKRKYLESVEGFCKEHNIAFKGYEYTAVADRPRSPLNKARVKLQLQVLEDEHKWLSDEEADQRIEKMYQR